MSVNRWMDKEDMMQIEIEYYSIIKMNEIGSFVEIWMDLDLSYRVKKVRISIGFYYMYRSKR